MQYINAVDKFQEFFPSLNSEYIKCILLMKSLDSAITIIAGMGLAELQLLLKAKESGKDIFVQKALLDLFMMQVDGFSQIYSEMIELFDENLFFLGALIQDDNKETQEVLNDGVKDCSDTTSNVVVDEALELANLKFDYLYLFLTRKLAITISKLEQSHDKSAAYYDQACADTLCRVSSMAESLAAVIKKADLERYIPIIKADK